MSIRAKPPVKLNPDPSVFAEVAKMMVVSYIGRILFLCQVKIGVSAFVALLNQKILGLFYPIRWNHYVQVAHMARSEIVINLQGQNRALKGQDRNIVLLKPLHDTHQFSGLCENLLRISVKTLFQTNKRGFRNVFSLKCI